MQLSDLLSSTSRPDLQRQLAAAPPLPAPVHRYLISGPARSGKTSLLFHLAYSMARQGRAVLLLCPRRAGLGGAAARAVVQGVAAVLAVRRRQRRWGATPPRASGPIVAADFPRSGGRGGAPIARRNKLELVPPLLPEGVQHSDATWQRVAVKYLASGEELLRYAASIHLVDAPPDVILVDDLHLLCDLPPPGGDHPRWPRAQAAPAALCRVLALLADAAAFLGARAGRPCLLAATDLGGGEGQRLYVCQRWLPLVLACRPAGQGIFRLAVVAPQGAADQFPAVDYSLRHAALTVEGVVPPSPWQAGAA
eukprot:scaffold20.g7725.t1